MRKKNRRHHTLDEKAKILREHLVDKTPVSEICNTKELQPSVFYGWHRQLVENIPAALASGKKTKREDSREAELLAKIEKLEARLAKKDSVIAELSEELVISKKNSGED
jgi:transposase